MEIANSVEPVQDGRIHIEKINGPFLYREGGSPAEYSAGMILAPTAAIPMRADINGAAGSLAAVPQKGIADFHHSRSLYQTRSPYTDYRLRIGNCRDSPTFFPADSTDPVWRPPVRPVLAREYARSLGSRSQLGRQSRALRIEFGA